MHSVAPSPILYRGSNWILQLLYKQSQQFHYNPVKIDDAFSREAYKDFINNMDGGKRFLTQKRSPRFDKYNTLLDDAFAEGTLFSMFQEIFMKSLDKTEAYYKEILNTDLMDSKDESIVADPDKRDYATDDKDLKEVWRRNIR
ncbi:MAG: hypothetical protein U0T81_16025 [Saprospiraceae bacterium]